MAQGKKVDWDLVEKSALEQKRLIEGNLIYWEKFGHGPQVVLCIAGLLGDIASNFHPVWEKMDVEQFTLIGIDLPGYGYSRPPERNYCAIGKGIYINDAKVAMQLMKELGIQKYSVLTHSGGGYVAMYLASVHPDAVEKVVFCNSPFIMDERIAKVAKLMTNLNVWDEPQRNHFLITYGKTYTEKVLNTWAYRVAKEARTNEMKNDFIGLLENMKVPVLAMCSTKDLVVKVDSAFDMKKYIPQLRIHTIPGGNHSHLTFLDEFVRVCEEFLKA